jgi:spore coat polysaccharide biosynthesis protein SpsF
MTTLCVIQARMGSTRLPGKVLADLGGRPMLQFMLARLRGLPVSELVVATSTEPSDDAVADASTALGVRVVRGPEQDVLARFVQALESHPADDVIRLTADCPLADPEVIVATLELHRQRHADYTSNVIPRTFPKGLDVEVARGEALHAAAAEADDPAEREHVMPFLYRHPERFRLATLRSTELLGDERWTVDTAHDLEIVRRAVNQLEGRHDFGWREVLEVLGRTWRAPRGKPSLRPAGVADHELVQAVRTAPEVVWLAGAPGRATWEPDRLDDPGTRLWLAEVDGDPFGIVRADVSAAIGEMSIVVAAGHGGPSRGAELLELLQRNLEGDLQVRALTAHVPPHDEAARKVFEAAGFVPDTRQPRLRWDKVA